MRRWSIALVLFLFGCSNARAADAPDAFEINRRLGRGVNLGNALDAPKEGEWGLTIKREYFELIKKAGFDHVRIPVRWSAHAESRPPYKIDAAFFARVDEVIAQVREQDLGIVLNMHHYDEIFPRPDEHRARFLAMWDQIAERYWEQPELFCFELLNEPHDQLSGKAWNDLAAETLALVRKSNRDRIVIIGPDQWNNYGKLASLDLPSDDRRLIATFHYYLPFEFTHQGAEWAQGSSKWLGRVWPQSEKEEQELAEHFASVAAWSKEQNRPIYLGEFGAYQKANLPDRVRWTKAVRTEAEKHDFSWAYWEFGSGFGIYNPTKQVWRDKLVKSLVD